VIVDGDLAALVRERLRVRLERIAADVPPAAAARVRAGMPAAEALREALAAAAHEIAEALAEADLALAAATRAVEQ
jgi:hypothetical protein